MSAPMGGGMSGAVSPCNTLLLSLRSFVDHGLGRSIRSTRRPGSKRTCRSSSLCMRSYRPRTTTRVRSERIQCRSPTRRNPSGHRLGRTRIVYAAYGFSPIEDQTASNTRKLTESRRDLRKYSNGSTPRSLLDSMIIVL